jgi:hypothetical protein
MYKTIKSSVWSSQKDLRSSSQIPQTGFEHTFRLQVYSDALYANNPDGSSQLGYIIFLADENGNFQPLFWCSHKSRRVTRSVLESETMALADAFDMAYALKHDIQTIIKQRVPIVIITDSLSLFDVIIKSST